MDSWDDLRFLLAVSKSGSMTGAASLLHTSVATVSRRLDRIATRMGTAPFIKTSEGWVASSAVSGLIDLAMDFEGNLKREINGNRVSPSLAPVTLRVGCTPTLLNSVLVPGLSLRGPEMNHIHFDFNERIFGDGLGDFDILISHGAPKAGRLRTRKLSEVTFAIYGPRSAASSGDWVGLSEAHDAYGVMQLGFSMFERPPVLRVDNLIALAQVIAETGLPGPLPHLLANEQGDLQPFGRSRFNADFWVSYHESRRGDLSIDLTLAWLDACFEMAENTPQSARDRTEKARFRN